MKKLCLYIIALLCFSCDTDVLIEEPSIKSSESVFAKDSYDSKKDLVISFNSSTDLNNIQISISGLLGINQLDNLLNESAIPIARISKEVQFVAGYYLLSASINGQITDKATLLLHPKSIQGKSTNFVGPKTTSFNDRAGSMITGFFQDEYYNLVDTSLTLTYQIQSNTRKEVQNTFTDHDYYFKKIIPSKNNTRQLVGVSAGKEYSEEITVIGSSGCPSRATVSISNHYNIADGHQIFNVDIDDIVDEDGAVVTDGNDMILIIESKNYKSSYGGVVINGSAKFIVLNPDIPGNYTIEIISCNQLISKKKDIVFKSAVQTIPYQINEEELIIGPLLSHLNQSIPNGTLIELHSVQCPQHTVLTTQTMNGFAIFKMEEMRRYCQSSSYSITINGIKSELLLTKKSNNDS